MVNFSCSRRCYSPLCLIEGWEKSPKRAFRYVNHFLVSARSDDASLHFVWTNQTKQHGGRGQIADGRGERSAASVPGRFGQKPLTGGASFSCGYHADWYRFLNPIWPASFVITLIWVCPFLPSNMRIRPLCFQRKTSLYNFLNSFSDICTISKNGISYTPTLIRSSLKLDSFSLVK